MKSLKEIVLSLRERTEMYIGYNSIHCLRAYLSGVSHFNQKLEDQFLMNDFQKWIEIKYKINSGQSWAHILNFYSNNEIEAIKLFFEEFTYFIEEKESGVPPQK